MKMLQVENIQTFYGKSHVLFGVSLDMIEGQVIGLVGRNGAGKSTTLKSIIGILSPRSGSIRFKGKEIISQPSFRIARSGIGYVPEDRRVFPDLTVLENLEIMTAVSRKSEESWSVERVFEWFPQLERLNASRGMELSGGEQQMLTIARTLMTNPEVLLLDEPSEGLAPIIVREIGNLIGQLRQTITILLAEQKLQFVLGLVDACYVIDQGENVFNGTAEELRSNTEIKKKFLGV
ncbi:MAG: ABC transporter ATP-binding protein [Candidatus Desulfacyla sp.]